MTGPVLAGLLAWVGFTAFIMGMMLVLIMIAGVVLLADIARHSLVHFDVIIALLFGSTALITLATTGTMIFGAALLLLSPRKVVPASSTEATAEAAQA